MTRLFQCQVCQSKILENHLQKHHTKVHGDVDHDIYTLLTTNDMPPPVASDTDADAKASINRFPNIPPPAVEKLVHVSCSICKNRMPAENLDQHMKRKHNDVCDQVDAVGAKVNSMTINVMEKSEVPTVLTAAKKAPEQFQAFSAPELMTSWPKAKNPFVPSFRFTATPKTDAATTTDLQPFYTVRVSVEQMKQLISENRIEPKEGYFYLK